ncbi:MAG: hypothetical protein WBQ16_08890, partial [Nitrososphaeraceae archaeon]
NNIEFSDSVCTCNKCNHNMTRDCTNENCKCCKKEDHMMVMDGMEAFEPNNHTGRTGQGIS